MAKDLGTIGIEVTSDDRSLKESFKTGGKTAGKEIDQSVRNSISGIMGTVGGSRGRRATKMAFSAYDQVGKAITSAFGQGGTDAGSKIKNALSETFDRIFPKRDRDVAFRPAKTTSPTTLPTSEAQAGRFPRIKPPVTDPRTLAQAGRFPRTSGDPARTASDLAYRGVRIRQGQASRSARGGIRSAGGLSARSARGGLAVRGGAAAAGGGAAGGGAAAAAGGGAAALAVVAGAVVAVGLLVAAFVVATRTVMRWGREMAATIKSMAHLNAAMAARAAEMRVGGMMRKMRSAENIAPFVIPASKEFSKIKNQLQPVLDLVQILKSIISTALIAVIEPLIGVLRALSAAMTVVLLAFNIAASALVKLAQGIISIVDKIPGMGFVPGFDKLVKSIDDMDDLLTDQRAALWKILKELIAINNANDATKVNDYFANIGKQLTQTQWTP